MMKKTLTLLLICLTLITSAQTGMLNGTGYAPDITVIDINGNTHNLYNYLDSGRVVVLELMSTTCGHCQQYAAGTDNSYQAYGPNGLDVAEFIGLEVNSSTSDNDLANFATTYGVSFPLCNNISPAAINYQLYYTPSYYVVYPDSSYVTFCPAYCQTTSSYLTIENLLNTAIQSWIPPVYGCTDSLAINYNPLANIDDGSCLYSYTCLDASPTGLQATNVIHDRATINWDNMNDSNCFVDQYRISYSDDGGATWSSKTMGQPVGSCVWACNKTDKLILNLTPSTTYTYRMQAWYCGGGNSVWTSNYTFTTEDECPNVGNLAVSTPSTTKATFTWDDSNGAYSFVRMIARVDSISNPQGSDWFNIGGSGVSYGTFTKDKNNLTPGQTYRGQARTWCDLNGGAWKSLAWTSLIYWTQLTVIRLEGGTTIANLAIFPNPLRDVFNVTFTSETIQDLKVRILNVVGEELINENLQQFIGEYTKQINLSNNAKGIYLLEIETNDGVINKKLMLL